MFRNLSLLYSISTIRITLIQGYGHLYKERISKNSLGSLLPLKSSYNKPLVDLFIVNLIVSLSRLFVAKYIKENLEKILRTVPKTCVPLFDEPFKKPLKTRLSNIYYNKFHIEYYNFYQQYEDYFATIGAKSLNYIFLQLFSCITTSTSIDNNISRSIKLKAQFLSIRKNLKLFFDKV